MDRRAPRPRQPVDDTLAAAVDSFGGGGEEVLSYLHGVAIANQPADAEGGPPVMVPVAFAARVSDKDNQDPTLSIPRQLSRCRQALPDYCVIVAFFWDVESGRLDLDQRGHSDAHEQFDVPVPRDGGIADLLDEARQPARRFVAVVCESVDRLSRITQVGTTIEASLEHCGVALLAADEGITAADLPNASGTLARKRATPILTRRVKQAIAEWYVLDMLEKSWGGLMEHTEQGYNIGKPPYGYQVITEPHPVPAKAALGKVKRRLVRDPVRGPVVTKIYTWRVVEHLSYDQIAERLNQDPDRYPPPEPILGQGRRAIGAWTKGSVRDVLCNPKYTGHMVYNRRKNPRKDRGVPGKVNAPGEWIWSSKPTHEPLTTKTQFLAGTPIGKSNRGSRTSDRPNRHPATTRTYRLRSHVICELCGRRLYGKTRRVGDGYSYYACEPVPAHHTGKPWYPSHPKACGSAKTNSSTPSAGSSPAASSAPTAERSSLPSQTSSPKRTTAWRHGSPPSAPRSKSWSGSRPTWSKNSASTSRSATRTSTSNGVTSSATASPRSPPNAKTSKPNSPASPPSRWPQSRPTRPCSTGYPSSTPTSADCPKTSNGNSSTASNSRSATTNPPAGSPCASQSTAKPSTASPPPAKRS